MMGPIGGPDTPTTNYQSTLPNIPEERKSHADFCYDDVC
jgi:hypothetical protein